MKTLIQLSCLSLLLSGCDATHLAYVHETNLGVNVSVSPESSTGRFVFGYDSDTYALVPRKGKGQDAMTLVSVGCIYVAGLDTVSFKHFVASGLAAQSIAQSKDTLSYIRSSITGGGSKCEQ